MGRTLILTSPAMTGEDVVQTQRLMLALDGSPYKVWDGPVSGIYGERTAAGVKHGKYVLGYPTSSVDEHAGDTFRGLLQTPPSKLPEDYQARRDYRLHPPSKPPRELALARALTQVGHTESPPGSNRTPYGAWYGFNGVSWCMIFQCWAGDPYEPVWDPHASRYAYVPYMLADAQQHKLGLSVVDRPIPGDLVLYFWSGLSDPGDSHVGRVIQGDASRWEAVEGNTSPSDRSNGGQVARVWRDPSEAAAHFFIRLAS